jgi:hypothetical protein
VLGPGGIGGGPAATTAAPGWAPWLFRGCRKATFLPCGGVKVAFLQLGV